jgi:hypothetical protein
LIIENARPGAALSAALAAALALGGCAGAPGVAPTCASGLRPMTADLLYFGTAMPHGGVSADDWRDFVDTVVTPRFPDGLTTWPASGQWRAADGARVREPSYVLDLVHVPDARSDAAIAEIVAAYRQRFHQEAVLRVATPACVAF